MSRSSGWGIGLTLLAGCIRVGFGQPSQRGGDPGGNNNNNGGDTVAPGGDGDPSPGGDGDSDTVVTGPLVFEISAVAVTSYDFATCATFSVTPLTVTAHNIGTAPVSLGGVDDASLGLAAPFGNTGGTCATSGSVPLGGSCTLVLTFRPVDPIGYSGTLTLIYADSSQHQATLTLSGQGGPPATCNDLGSGTTYDALGRGTQQSPYLLCIAEQLADLSSHPEAWRSFFAQGSDIDVSGLAGLGFTPLGSTSAPFGGVYDGGGYSLQGFSYNHSASDYVGLFGYVDGSFARLERVVMTGVSVTGNAHVGALAGEVSRGAVLACSATGSVTGGLEVGGLLGVVSFDASISTSWTDVTVQGTSLHNGSGHGGLVGRIGDGTTGGFVWDSYAQGTVDGSDTVGGLIGTTNGTSWVARAYAIGDVTASGGSIGGLVGASQPLTTFSNCFASGAVTSTSGATNSVGKLVGCGDSGAGCTGSPVVSSGFDLATSSCTTSGGCHAALTGEGSGATLAALYDPSNAPVSTWDPSTWAAPGSVPPTLTSALFDYGAWGDCTGHTALPFAAGNGTRESPYLVCTPSQLDSVGLTGTYAGSVFRLMTDIDLSGGSLAHIPFGHDGTNPWIGIFEGNGHVIRNFTVDNGGSDYAGLFGEVYGMIERLGVEGGTVQNGHNLVSVLDAEIFGTISDCYAVGSASGTSVLGGVCGDLAGSSIAIDSYADVTITSATNGGGLVGDPCSVRISYSFAVGDVTVANDGGPVSEGHCLPTIDHGYYDSDASCSGCDNTDGTGVSVSATPDYFESKANEPLSAWDFDNVWQENSGKLPTLRPGGP